MDSQDSQTLVITIHYGGLGDHLFFSHIPRIAKESNKGGGYKKVYIRATQDFRDSQYKKLIWEANPYVDGIIEPHAHTAEREQIHPERAIKQEQHSCNERIESHTILKLTKNLLDDNMLALGLDDGKRFHEPEIYYKPKFKEEYHKVIFDPNYISNAGRNLDTADIMHYFETNNIQLDAVLAKRNDSNLFDYRANIEVIETKSLEDFCDLLYSAKSIYCLVTGTATLAAALGKSANVIVGKNISPIFLHSPLHTYIYLLHNKNLYKVWYYRKNKGIKLKVKHINQIAKLLPTKALKQSFKDIFVCENLHRIQTFNPITSNAEIGFLFDVAQKLGIKLHIIFEFGSRYGEDSVGFAQEAQRRGVKPKIYSFECNDKTLPQCLQAIAPYDNIILTQKAISQNDGFITFYPINEHETQTTHSDGNQGASSMLKASGKYPIEQYVQDEVQVPSTRLDTFMNEHNISHIDILWMDIQGGELEALKSLGKRISDIKIIYTEVEFIEIYENQPLFEDIKAYLQQYDFVFVSFLGKCEYFANALFVHKTYYTSEIALNVSQYK